jgi:hypothetical protein
MRRPWRQNQPGNLLFALSDEGVAFRNRWRSFVAPIVWMVLSGFTMLLVIFGVPERLHIAILIGMSFLKYIPLLIVVYGLARKMAARYLDDIYELDDEDLASSFLEEVTFGYGREKIIINEGRISEEDERSPVILIGGPGLVQVNLDSVALLEKLDGEPRVIHPRGTDWKLARFERIREIGRRDEVGKREYAIINLRDQFVSGLSIKSRTKDGIPIEAQDIKVIFSILRREKSETEAVQGDAYLFEPSAVESLVYNQTLITPEPSSASGVSFPWNTTVIPLINSELEDLITSRTLSEILATIGQREVDESSTNEQTIAKMRVEMTGQTFVPGARKDSPAPRFESRSRITAQFYDPAFKEKAAQLGVSIEWIDIGTWQLPSSLILDKHKEAWSLSRDNSKKRAAIERSKKKYELEEIAKLVNSVIIAHYETKTTRFSEKDRQTTISFDSDGKRDFMLEDANRKNPTAIALEILKAFRKELLNAKLLIENDKTSPLEKRLDLANIDKALYDINILTNHWVTNK